MVQDEPAPRIMYEWLDKMVVLALVFDVSLSADLALNLDVPKQWNIPHMYASHIVLPPSNGHSKT